ncbi:MAG: hypothetical protein ACO3WK_12790 [Steroidobacteraceae bacterium]
MSDPVVVSMSARSDGHIIAPFAGPQLIDLGHAVAFRGVVMATVVMWMVQVAGITEITSPGS